MKKEKRLKTISVQYSTRVKTENGGPLRRPRYKQCPRITMEGEWLERLGFHIGDKLHVEYGDGSINICLADAGVQPAMVCEDTGEYAARDKEERARDCSGAKGV